MANDETQRLLDEIGRLLAEETGQSLASILLYAQLDVNVVGTDIFMDGSDRVEYSWSGDRLTYPLLDLWEEEEPAKRWTEMEYVLCNGKFAVTFVYPGQFDPEENFFERRKRVVARHFGDKPIVYPPMPDYDVQQFNL